MSSSALPWEEAARQQRPPWEEAAAAAKPEPVQGVPVYHMSAGRGNPVSSPGHDYSSGYAPEGKYRRFSGPFIERAASQFGEDLNDPSNFLPSKEGLKDLHLIALGPLGMPGFAYRRAKEAWDTWEHRNDPQPDPAETVGHMGVPLLSALVTHAGDMAPNMGSGSTFVRQGIAHPVQGVSRFVKALPEPDVVSMVRRPISTAVRTARGVPAAVRQGLGENIRIQPAPRVEPAWKTAPTEPPVEGISITGAIEPPNPAWRTVWGGPRRIPVKAEPVATAAPRAPRVPAVARSRNAPAAPIEAPPEAPSVVPPPTVSKPPVATEYTPVRGIRDLWDDQAVREQIEEAIQRSDRAWTAELQAERNMARFPGTSKGQMAELLKNPASQPSDFGRRGVHIFSADDPAVTGQRVGPVETPYRGEASAEASQPLAATLRPQPKSIVPGADEDLTALMQQSIEQVKQSKMEAANAKAEPVARSGPRPTRKRSRKRSGFWTPSDR